MYHIKETRMFKYVLDKNTASRLKERLNQLIKYRVSYVLLWPQNVFLINRNLVIKITFLIENKKNNSLSIKNVFINAGKLYLQN